MSKFQTLCIGATLAVASIGAFAQTTPATPRVDQRQANQEKRIEQGIASGQLNAKETHRLDQQQARVAAAESQAKADGKVTKAERKKMHRMQDRASKNIHAQKHDAQTAAKAAKN
jgi:tellurite resistance protein